MAIQDHSEAHLGNDEHAERRSVVVELNGDAKEIRGGRYKGSHLKRVLGVPLEHELELVVYGEFKPIANDDHVEVRGGEKFVSHCGQGQSS